MTFERATLLALAPLLALLLGLAVTSQWRRGRRLVEAFGGERAAARLTAGRPGSFPGARLAALCAAALVLFAGAAGPHPADPPPPTERPIDLVVALDLSWSMSADDVDGTRAARAAEVLRAVTEALPRDRVGLTVFADWPYTLVPVTHDLDVVRYFGARMTPELVADRDQGTGIGEALSHAAASLDERPRPEAERAILLLSDGESYGDPSAALDSAAAVSEAGARVWIGGIGTARGAALTRSGSGGEPLVDERGETVTSALDEAFLRELAAAGRGAFHDVTSERGLRALLDDLAGTEATRAETPAPIDPVFWLTLLALPLLVWEGASDTPHRRRTRREGNA